MPDELDFPGHVRQRMRRRQVPEAAVYHVVGDADEILERDDGRTEYTGMWEDRTIRVVIEADGRTVVTVIDMTRGSRP
jgi:hypothetical protein